MALHENAVQIFLPPLNGDAASPRVSHRDDESPQPGPVNGGEELHECGLREDVHDFLGPSCEDTCVTQPHVQQGRPQELTTEGGLGKEMHSSKCPLDLDLERERSPSCQTNGFRSACHHAASQSTTLPDISEVGAPEPSANRAEEVAIQAMKLEFEKAAGYPAAFEEFESHLVYEQNVVDDGETIHVREVLIGARFSPEPFMRSLRRVMQVVILQVVFALVLAVPLVLTAPLVWKTCESNMAGVAIDFTRIAIGWSAFLVWFVALVEGCRPRRILRRIRELWILLAITVAAHAIARSLAISPQLTPYTWISFALERAVYTVMVPWFFWHVSRDMTGVVKRRVLYTIQMTFLVYTPWAASHLWGRLLLPKAEGATTDTEKTRLAFVCLLSCFPLVAIVNGTARKMRDGPPLFNYCVIFPIALISLVVPRLLQAEMAALSYKIKSSLLFALYDLLGDLAVPYVDMFNANVIRALMRTRDGRSAKPTDDRRSKPRDTASRHGLSGASGSSETVSTQATTNKEPALFINGSGSGEPRRSSSEIYQSVVRAGRRMRSSSSGLSSMTSVIHLQSNFMAYDVRPRYLRALSDQQHAYNQAESLILIFINLSLILMEQLLSPFSLSRLFERLGGLCLLVAVEMACEVILYMVSTRLHNLPILRSEDEPGVLTFRLTTLLAATAVFTAVWAPYITLFVLRALQPAVYDNVRLTELCPFFAHPYYTT
ncbi:unnamed protein product [Vitrella brassicaformis CCMP3155]|uniref:Transmembrane protein n=1 Tax=Vitrella brassicaformis (strain CCMP3155) TaxID=1169540 RepID=A0A0G4GNZ6_VITBC|nr:unnamed protein product [Vitrella brassicaformis CCMP3155]|eukprot:CEM31895.1 unnamed protein product [Vitrella brassicaformis CCMP3155]